MREQILRRFEENIARVRNLVSIYRSLAGIGQGRRPIHASDLLRGATVLLHAALEEVLRSTAEWRYPVLGDQVLDDVPLIGQVPPGRPKAFFLGSLAVHRNKTVQQLINESIRGHLNYFNINGTTEVASFLVKVGVHPAGYEPYFPNMAKMIERRHHIVHQADRNDQPGRGQHRALSLSSERVNEWIEATDQFVRKFLAEVPDELL